MMRKLNVCLVFPRLRYISGDPPLGLGYLAAYLKKNTRADVSIIDATFLRSKEAVLARLKEGRADILGIYSDGIMVKDAIGIADWAKNNKIYTVIGGPQATVDPGSFIAHADLVVEGEGELTLAEIVRSYGCVDLAHIPGIWWKKNKETIKNPINEDFIPLDEVPFPDRGSLPMDKYLYHWNYLDAVDTNKSGTTLIATRGCPFSCRYCQPTVSRMFGRRVRFRSPEDVAEEIKELKNTYNIGGVFFHDDTFTLDHAWLESFCRILDDKRIGIYWGCNSRVDTVNEDILKMMYDAGLRSIHFGIESGSQRVLDSLYDKKIDTTQVKDAVSAAQRAGVSTMGFFMLGAPSETEKEIGQTISLARSLRLNEATFSLTTPLAGTYLYDDMLSDSRYKISDNNDDFNYYSRYAIGGQISRSRIKFLQLKALLFFYLHPFRLGYLGRHLLSLRGLKKLINKIRRFS
ncbi:MAG: radical SAM protein [Candidatus Omnitrophota bacterium]